MRHTVLTAAPVTITCLCGKAYSPTKADARRLRRDIEAYKHSHHEVRFYACEHGGWHWTRRIDRRP